MPDDDERVGCLPRFADNSCLCCCVDREEEGELSMLRLEIGGGGDCALDCCSSPSAPKCCHPVLFCLCCLRADGGGEIAAALRFSF